MKLFFRDAGLILLCVALFVALECFVVDLAYRVEFVASWEVTVGWSCAFPIAIASCVPIALFLAASTRLAKARAGARILSMSVGAMSAAFVLEVDSRSLQNTSIRTILAVVAAAIGVASTSRAIRLIPKISPRVHALVGFGIAIALSIVNATVLVRLYPPIHAALLALALVFAASPARALLTLKNASKYGFFAIAMGAFCILWAPRASARLAPCDNLRLIFLEHAPALSVAVRVGAAIAPPPPLDDENGAATAKIAEVTRSLDWTHRDIVLISIDALRADHLGAYGYARATSPNIDALAKDGVVFDHAYCPTPHTSHSVTSMMTGKYMRPLLKMNLGDDSETFAAIMRRYGYKTAAFYPPAVFFIDEEKFTGFRDRGLDFEYRKVEFADPPRRETQIRNYLDAVDSKSPMFLWVHIFEPHEPYVFHADHPFGDPGRPTDVDRYDSEIAAADDLVGRVVRLIREKKRDAVFIVTADHGEEFGDHGGHHHGTTVFEEQVRVPLIVMADGILPAHVGAPAQTIDILPTVLSALGVPRPARIRGRDLGPEIAAHPTRDSARDADPGFAFVDTDDFAMIARGSLRLVCQRKLALCTLYDLALDPAEKHDVSREHPADVEALKKLLRGTELEHGRFEGASKLALPDALRRGLQGDADAADDVATLLDDASPEIRALAAETSFKLHATSTVPALRHALSSSDDGTVKRFAALALVRAGEPASPLAEELARGTDATWRKRAALVFAERGDARGASDLVLLFTDDRAEFEDAKTVLLALSKIRAKEAVPVLVTALSDVRLRPYVADALGAIGAQEARAPLLALFRAERYPAARVAEAKAIVALGGGGDVYTSLRRFAGVPEPMFEALSVARDAHLLDAAHGAISPRSDADAGNSLDGEITISPEKNQRILVLEDHAGAIIEADVDGTRIVLAPRAGGIWTGDFASTGERKTAHVHVTSARLAWVVPLADDVALPPPEAWDSGVPDAEP